jgi:hypothetical protein
MQSETLWFIVGTRGLYDGGRRTRRQAIADHVNAIDEICYRDDLLNTYGPLTENQRRAWSKCQRNGDRAVKATIMWGGAADAE